METVKGDGKIFASLVERNDKLYLAGATSSTCTTDSGRGHQPVVVLGGRRRAQQQESHHAVGSTMLVEKEEQGGAPHSGDECHAERNRNLLSDWTSWGPSPGSAETHTGTGVEALLRGTEGTGGEEGGGEVVLVDDYSDVPRPQLGKESAASTPSSSTGSSTAVDSSGNIGEVCVRSQRGFQWEDLNRSATTLIASSSSKGERHQLDETPLEAKSDDDDRDDESIAEEGIEYFDGVEASTFEEDTAREGHYWSPHRRARAGPPPAHGTGNGRSGSGGGSSYDDGGKEEGDKPLDGEENEQKGASQDEQQAEEEDEDYYWDGYSPIPVFRPSGPKIQLQLPSSTFFDNPNERSSAPLTDSSRSSDDEGNTPTTAMITEGQVGEFLAEQERDTARSGSRPMTPLTTEEEETIEEKKMEETSDGTPTVVLDVQRVETSHRCLRAALWNALLQQQQQQTESGISVSLSDMAAPGGAASRAGLDISLASSPFSIVKKKGEKKGEDDSPERHARVIFDTAERTEEDEVLMEEDPLLTELAKQEVCGTANEWQNDLCFEKKEAFPSSPASLAAASASDSCVAVKNPCVEPSSRSSSVRHVRPWRSSSATSSRNIAPGAAAEDEEAAVEEKEVTGQAQVFPDMGKRETVNSTFLVELRSTLAKARAPPAPASSSRSGSCKINDTNDETSPPHATAPSSSSPSSSTKDPADEGDGVEPPSAIAKAEPVGSTGSKEASSVFADRLGALMRERTGSLPTTTTSGTANKGSRIDVAGGGTTATTERILSIGPPQPRPQIRASGTPSHTPAPGSNSSPVGLPSPSQGLHSSSFPEPGSQVYYSSYPRFMFSGGTSGGRATTAGTTPREKRPALLSPSTEEIEPRSSSRASSKRQYSSGATALASSPRSSTSPQRSGKGNAADARNVVDADDDVPSLSYRTNTATTSPPSLPPHRDPAALGYWSSSATNRYLPYSSSSPPPSSAPSPSTATATPPTGGKRGFALLPPGRE